MYVADRPAAVREIHRVLRPGGWAAVFDLLMAESTAWAWWRHIDLAPFQPEHDVVSRYRQEHEPFWEPVYTLDERSLAEAFLGAGFETVNTRIVTRSTQDHGEWPGVLHSHLYTRHWLGPTYADAARVVLGGGAAPYLARLGQAPLPLPGRRGSQDVYVFAQK